MALTLSPVQGASTGGFNALPGTNPAIGVSGFMVASPGDGLEEALLGTLTVTGDGVATTATIFYINSATALSYTPTGVILKPIGGTNTAASVPVPSAVTNTQFTITWSAAIANTTTQIIAVYLVK
jgi:hypothetical protein